MNRTASRSSAGSSEIVWVRSSGLDDRGNGFKGELNAAINVGTPVITINLQGIDSIGSADIGNLVAARLLCEEKGLILRLRNVHASVARSLSDLSMLKLFEKCIF